MQEIIVDEVDAVDGIPLADMAAMPPCLFDQVHPDELQDPGSDDDCDEDANSPEAMEQQFAYNKGILALYRTPFDCPHWASVTQPGLVACGRVGPGAFTTWGALRPVWR